MSKNNLESQTASYMELANQSYSAIVETFAAANKRRLDLAKQVFEIASRPYNTTAIESAYRENFDRANQFVALAVEELQASGTQMSELAQKLTNNGLKYQENVQETVRGLLKTSVSNLNWVKDTAGQSLDGFAKRVEDVTVSHN